MAIYFGFIMVIALIRASISSPHCPLGEARLARQTGEKHVSRHFERCGRVRHVQLVRDRYGNHKGCAYVEMATLEAAQLALLLSGRAPAWSIYVVR